MIIPIELRKQVLDRYGLLYQISLGFTNPVDPKKSLMACYACLSVVTQYENIIKDSIMRFGDNFQGPAGDYFKSSHDRLNAGIKPDDLKKVAKSIGNDQSKAFSFYRQQAFNYCKTHDLEVPSTSLTTMTDWRHEFVHQGTTPCTFESLKPHIIPSYLMIRAFCLSLVYPLPTLPTHAPTKYLCPSCGKECKDPI